MTWKESVVLRLSSRENLCGTIETRDCIYNTRMKTAHLYTTSSTERKYLHVL